tara:strand:+ start:7223 stop:7387 length:165 start_codon:yes stop_codon:yes gene_type:complete
LANFDGGKIVFLISRMPYRCPAAPFEAAFLIDSMLRDKGTRDQVDMGIHAPDRA